MPKVGDVVYCEGSSAILGDVVKANELEDSYTVVWRTTTTVECAEDLTVESEGTK